MSRRTPLCAALVLSAVGCSGPRESAVQNKPAMAPCTVAGTDARCGSLTVPENRTSRTGRTIALNIVILPAEKQPPAADPIFYLAGGPGQGATTLAPTGIVDLALRDQHDLVFVDQRGTGQSNPLDCELPGSPANPQGYLDEVFQTTVFERCRDLLAAKADLTQYTTAAAADDLDDVRAAFGYARLNLSGGSYGTRMALTYMRRHPERVRSAVLNGVAPPSLRNPLYHARESQRAIDGLFDECAANPPCRAAFPRVRDEFQAVLSRLDREPARGWLSLPDAAPVPVTINRYAFADTIRWMLYSLRSSRQVPLAVHRAHKGDFSIVVQRAAEQRRSVTRLAHGMLLSTTCTEDVARIREDDIAAVTAGTFLGADRVRQQQRVCAVWPQPEKPAEGGAPIHSEASVLLLSGTLDPVTPPHWADEALRSLPNGRHIVVPGAHGVGGPCIAQIVREFLRAGTAKDLGTACTSEVRLPPFVIN